MEGKSVFRGTISGSNMEDLYTHMIVPHVEGMDTICHHCPDCYYKYSSGLAFYDFSSQLESKFGTKCSWKIVLLYCTKYEGKESMINLVSVNYNVLTGA